MIIGKINQKTPLLYQSQVSKYYKTWHLLFIYYYKAFLKTFILERENKQEG